MVVRRRGVPARDRSPALRGQGEPAAERQGSVPGDSGGPDRLQDGTVAAAQR